MLRIAITLLLLANVGYYAWSQNLLHGLGLSPTAEAEPERLAQQIEPDSAVESASWGLFQIMGFHWRTLGYTSAEAFAAAMTESEGRQLDAFVRFIKADAGLHRALRSKDWSDFARRYNGPNYASNKYDVKLAAAYEEFA